MKSSFIKRLKTLYKLTCNFIKTHKIYIVITKKFLIDFSIILTSSCIVFWVLGLIVPNLFDIVIIFLAFLGANITINNIRISSKQNLLKYYIYLTKPLFIGIVLYIILIPIYGTTRRALITPLMSSVYFILYPLIKHLTHIQSSIKASYKRRKSILFIDENCSGPMEEIVNDLAKKYDIAGIISGKQKFNVRNTVYFRDLKDLEKHFLSLRYSAFPNPIRQLIYISDEANLGNIKKLLSFSAEYNMKFFHAPYLLTTAKNTDLNGYIIPMTINDIATYDSLGIEQRKFLINFCKEKNVWINYNGEDIIKSLILSLANAGPNFINIYTTSERYISEINTMFKDKISLPYSIKTNSMKDDLCYKNITLPNCIFYTIPHKDPALGFDNTINIFQQNTLETIQLINESDRNMISDFFLLTDISATFCTNWTGITNRLAELYAKATSLKRFKVIRLQFSENDNVSVLKDMNNNIPGSLISTNNRYDPIYSADNMLNSLISAIFRSSEYMGNTLIVKNSDIITAKSLYKLFLNIYGLHYAEGLWSDDSSPQAIKTDVFEALKNVEIKKTLDDDLYYEANVITLDRNQITTLLTPFEQLIRNNNVSATIDLVVKTIKQIYYNIDKVGEFS